MQRCNADIIDRWSISKLKFERTGTKENDKEFHAFDKEKEKLVEKYKDFHMDLFCKQMYDINNFIWLLESGLKGGKEELLDAHYILAKVNEKSLVKIGATTILIRNFNHLRVGLKNIINTLTNSGFQDIKSNHLSE